MIVECQNCSAKYKVDETTLKNKVSQFKCKKCDSLVTVAPQQEKDTPQQEAEAPHKESAPPVAGTAFMKKEATVAPAKGSDSKKKVVVADDTAFFRIMLSDLLLESGYEVIAAVDGEDALNKVKHELPDLDLLLLDMLMPKMDGFAVIEEIKKGALGKDLPILAISGVFKSDEDREVMKKLGVIGYIDKSTPPEDIIKRVNLILKPEGVS